VSLAVENGRITRDHALLTRKHPRFIPARVPMTMYLAVVATIVAQALLLARPVLLVYAAIAFATMAAFTRCSGRRTDRERPAY
jgi:hypothetical protein